MRNQNWVKWELPCRANLLSCFPERYSQQIFNITRKCMCTMTARVPTRREQLVGKSMRASEVPGTGSNRDVAWIPSTTQQFISNTNTSCASYCCILNERIFTGKNMYLRICAITYLCIICVYHLVKKFNHHNRFQYL